MGSLGEFTSLFFVFKELALTRILIFLDGRRFILSLVHHHFYHIGFGFIFSFNFILISLTLLQLPIEGRKCCIAVVLHFLYTDILNTGREDRHVSIPAI